MSAEAAREDACREYQSSLEDLTFNSKPHINMLTILAEENLHFSEDIVAIIEAQIAKVFMKIAFFFVLSRTWQPYCSRRIQQVRACAESAKAC